MDVVINTAQSIPRDIRDVQRVFLYILKDGNLLRLLALHKPLDRNDLDDCELHRLLGNIYTMLNTQTLEASLYQRLLNLQSYCCKI